MLSIDIDTYNASEIDVKAMKVSSFRHGDIIKRVGDVKKLLQEQVLFICILYSDAFQVKLVIAWMLVYFKLLK